MKPVSRVNTSSTEGNLDQNRLQDTISDRNSQDRSTESREEGRSNSASFAAGTDLGNLGKTLNGYVDQARDVASDVMSKAQEYGSGAFDETSSFIRKYPGQTLAAGFGLGVLLGITLARR